MSNQRHGVLRPRLSARLDHGPERLGGGRDSRCAPRSSCVFSATGTPPPGTTEPNHCRTACRPRRRRDDGPLAGGRRSLFPQGGQQHRHADCRGGAGAQYRGHAASSTRRQTAQIGQSRRCHCDLRRPGARQAGRGRARVTASRRGAPPPGRAHFAEGPATGAWLVPACLRRRPGRAGKSPRARPRPVPTRRHPGYGGLDGTGPQGRDGGRPRGHRRHDRHVRRGAAFAARAPQGSGRQVRNGQPHFRSTRRSQNRWSMP